MTQIIKQLLTPEILEDKTKNQLLELLVEKNIDSYDMKNRKDELIEAVIRHANPDEVDMSLFKQYQVRYVGPHHQQIIHSYNSTPSGEEYTFPRGQWITVEEKDYNLKYEPFVSKALAAENIPHWEVRRTNPVTGKFIEFYLAGVRKLLLKKKPESLMDMLLLSEEKVIKLEGYHVRTIKELIAMPDVWISRILGLNYLLP